MIWFVEGKKKARDGNEGQLGDEGKEGTSRGTIKAKANSISPYPM